MKKLIYLLSFTFLMLQSCSSGDGSGSENSNITFLENYNGTDWKWEDGHGYILYYRFNNTIKNPFTIYSAADYTISQPCLGVIPVSSSPSFNITENSTNKLVVQIYSSSAEYSFYKFELKNGVMSLTEDYYKDNIFVEESYEILFKESINKKNIPICN